MKNARVKYTYKWRHTKNAERSMICCEKIKIHHSIANEEVVVLSKIINMLKEYFGSSKPQIVSADCIDMDSYMSSALYIEKTISEVFGKNLLLELRAFY